MQAIVGSRRWARQAVRSQAALGVRRYAVNVCAPETEQGQDLEDRAVGFLADDERHLGRAAQALVLDVPPGATQHRVPRRREPGGNCRCRPEHEGTADSAGARRLLQPVQRRLAEECAGGELMGQAVWSRRRR